MRRLSMLGSSLGLIAGKGLLLGLGFVFWLVAARAFPEKAVGLTGAVVSAVMLCVQIGHLGVGSAFVVHYPGHERRPGLLLDAGLRLVLVNALAAGTVFLLIAFMGLGELSAVATDPLYAALFITMCVFGTVGVFLDQVSMAQHRGDHIFIRNLGNGIVTVLPVVLVSLAGSSGGSPVLFGFWVAGSGAAVALGFAQQRSVLRGYRPRLRLESRILWRLVRTGIPNQALTLAERAPAFVLPIVVTELLSPADNAHWYVAWMAAWAVTVIPISLGTALFSEAVQSPVELARHIRRALRYSMVLGAPAALLLAAAAVPILSLMGSAYAAGGATPLRILLAGILPVSVLHTYFGACRAIPGALKEGIVTAAAASSTAILAATVASRYGLPGMAWSWVAGLLPAATWAAWRLHRMSVSPASSISLRAEPALAVGA